MSEPTNFTLTENHVDVWCAALDVDSDQVKSLAALLSPDEYARASRFHFAKDCRRFTVARGLLRALLASYVCREPELLEFNYGQYGKPRLAGQSAVRFNVSHSNEMAVYAFTLNREVGIDVEYTGRNVLDMDQLAARCFSPGENAALQQVQKSQRREAFFNCWTRKEAYIKATGEGLSRPLDQFEVTLRPGEPAQLVFVEGQPQEITRWTFQVCQPAEDYVAALAVEGQGWQLRSWHGLS